MKLKVSSKKLIQFLNNYGFELHHIKGSHNVLIKENCVWVVVPERKEIAIGTLNAILRETGISRNELELWLKKKVKRRGGDIID